MYRKKLWLLLFILAAASSALLAQSTPPPQPASKNEASGMKILAVIETSIGKITAELYPEKAPETVRNFVGLAEGTKEFLDLKTGGQPARRRFYDGLKFHRVIPQFMIQGGCPLGNGTGGPGYRFKDEISDLKFDRPGRLAMANAGPDTNGSQFFITEVPTPWLDGRHTIFGQVIEGQDVANRIARVPRGPRDAPVEDVLIKKIMIVRKMAGTNIKNTTSKVGEADIMSRKILFIVAPVNFRDEEYFEPKKILESGGVKVTTASLKKGTLSGMLGAKAESDLSLDEVKPSDYDGAVFVGGSGAEIFWSDPKAHALARYFAQNQKTLGAICIAPVTLEKAGVLKGKKVTAFPSVKPEMKSSVYTGNRTEIDGKIITAAGPEAAGDFGRALLDVLNR